MLHHSRFVLALTVPLALAVGCSKPAEKAAAPVAKEATPAEVKAHMADHFVRVREIEEAVIRGDIDGAKAPAQWIADHQETTGLPGGSAVYVKTMKDAATSVATAADIDSAAKGAATLVGTCGNCHSAANVKTSLPAPTLATGKDGKAAHMAEHQFAVDLMYRGLVGPSDEDWAKGTTALATAPLGGKDLPEAKDSLAAEKKVHQVAEAAAKATDRNAKIAAYGDVIGSCASCHGLHGRIWGPGLPKAD